MKEIVVDGVVYVPKDTTEKSNEVIVRTYSAGVHIGSVKSREGKEVVLTGARRLWKWAGAFTLNEVSKNGVNRKDSRISEPVDEILILEAIEIIPISKGVDLSTTEAKK